MSCNQNCNQGRRCTCVEKPQIGPLVAAIVAMAVMAATLLAAIILTYPC